MGIAYRCDTDRGITLSVWDGVITIDDWRDHVRRQLADPQWPGGRLSLTDARSARHLFTAYEICDIAAMYRSEPARITGIRVARIGAEDSLAALTFQQAIGPSGPTTLVFDDLESASRWLGIQAADVQPMLDDLRDDLRTSDRRRLGYDT
jgi:hypothetical protein